DGDENPYNFALTGTGTVSAPEIAIFGNSVEIANADNTPSTDDHTDFGTIATDGGTVIRTFTIENTGDADLTIGTISFLGLNASDFTVSASPAATVAPA